MTFWTHLKYSFPGEVKFQEPLKNYTSFGIGGPADGLIDVNSLEKLSKIVSLASDYQHPLFMLGRGTNLLVLDRGIRGLVIRLTGEFTRAGRPGQGETPDWGNRLIGGAACPLSSLLRLSVEHNLSGLEFVMGIPGSLGGAVYMNAGAGGEEIGPLVREIHLVYPDGSTGVRAIGRPFENFFYRRYSISPGEIITHVTLQLRKAESKEAIMARIRQNYAWRTSNQPIEEKSAGCTFKNPQGESAGRLIDQAGLKGLSVGGAQVSTTHANFIINRSEASSSDVLRLIDIIQKKVYQSSGITLETEVLIIGEEG